MLCALAVAAGTLLLSAVMGVIIVAVVSVLSTILAAPAALALFGSSVARGGPSARTAGGQRAPRSRSLIERGTLARDRHRRARGAAGSRLAGPLPAHGSA